MTHWIRRPSRHHVPILQQHYTWVHGPSSGLMFDVDDRTRQVVLQPELRDAYAQAEVAAGRMIDQGIQDFGMVQDDPGAIRCCCGRTVGSSW